MQSISIFPVTRDDGPPLFRAVTGTAQSEGRTAGEALDALSANLPTGNGGTVVLIQPFRPDEFFSDEQRARLELLMGQWRAAQDGGPALTSAEATELELLIETELRAATARTSQALQELGE